MLGRSLVTSTTQVQHIRHKYSKEMSKKSEVVVMNVLMKDETKHSDMISIMELMQTYFGTEHNDERRVLSGGDLNSHV